MESEAYLIAAAQGAVQAFSGRGHAQQVRPTLEALLGGAGVPPRSVQEIHWHGGDDEYWLGSLDESFGFAPDVARFQWPVTPLLVHYVVQSSARAMEAKDRELVIVAQETGGQVCALLLASPVVVGRHNLSPQARVARKFSLSSRPGGLIPAAMAALEKADRLEAEQATEDEVAASELPQPGVVQWCATARKGLPGMESFRGAQWLLPGGDLPSGDLFLLAALSARLAESKAPRGMLLSEGSQKAGLATVLERV
jgi:hypothetical protein